MSGAVLTIQRTWSVAGLVAEIRVKTQYVPLCIMCSQVKPWYVVPVHGVCVKCGLDADRYLSKKIIRRGLTVR